MADLEATLPRLTRLLARFTARPASLIDRAQRLRGGIEDSLNLDEVALTKLLIACEDEFNIGLRDDDFTACVTVRDLAVLIASVAR
jgi:acyl carrier protein